MCFETQFKMEYEESNAGKDIYRVVPFEGKKDEWRKWSRKFLAHARYKGFKKLLEGKETYPDPDDNGDFTEEEEKVLERLEKLNHKAYNALIHLINDDVSFNAVDTAHTNRYPDGCAATAWSKLMTRWEPQTLTTVFELESEFARSKLEDVSRNPEEWITELEYIRNKITNLGSNFSDERFLGHVLTNLPEEYDPTVEAIQREMLMTTYTPNLEETLVLLRTKYKLLESRGSTKKEESALITKGFKGRCRKCGAFGHKAVDCRKSESTNSEDVTCFYCKKKGHRIAECFKLKKKKEKENGKESANPTSEKTQESKKDKVLMASDASGGTKNLWILDSGATMHMTKSDEGLFEIENKESNVTIGDGTNLKVTKEGNKRFKVIQKDGKTFEVTMRVKVVPQIQYNLISMNRLMSLGFKLSNEGTTVILEDEDIKLKFDRKIESASSSFLIGIQMEICLTNEMGMTSISRNKVDKMYAHQLLGHAHEGVVTETAKALGWNVVGTNNPCVNCATAKSKQKAVPKESTSEPVKGIGERIMIDISSIASKSFGGGKYWLLVMDEWTRFKWTFILKQKNELSDTMCEFIRTMKQKHSITIKSVRCDNAGENRAWQDKCKQLFPDLRFEFTAPNKPQQNGKVQRALATLYGHVRSMFNAAGIDGDLRNGLWAECARTATLLENILVYDEKSAHEKFFGEVPKWTRNLHIFGEVAILL